jgi:hypothetical protein
MFFKTRGRFSVISHLRASPFDERWLRKVLSFLKASLITYSLTLWSFITYSLTLWSFITLIIDELNMPSNSYIYGDKAFQPRFDLSTHQTYLPWYRSTMRVIWILKPCLLYSVGFLTLRIIKTGILENWHVHCLNSIVS